MTRLRFIGVGILMGSCVASALAAGASTTQPVAVAPATDQEKAALLDRMKSLAGTWEMKDAKGKSSTIVFAVSAAGSAVREIMFPGDKHEMTNMFHMDGPTMLMVHYCAEGNQPHMRAGAQDAAANRIDFKYDSVTNLTSATQSYMGQVSYIFKDADHIREEWTSLKNGQTFGQVGFDLQRKKD